jgi:hypothetical protein
MRYHRLLAVAAALTVSASLTACSEGQAENVVVQPPSAAAPSASTAVPPEPASAAPTGETPRPAATAKAKPKPKPTPKAPGQGSATSDLSGLRSAGIKSGAAILIDVADDGVNRYLQVGKSGVVDFTGTTRTDSTMMSLQPAAVSASNRVVIKPPFYNEDLGDGYCVADTAGAPLALEVCKAGKASQIFRVVLAGDSGQFELHGAYGVIRVGDDRITAGGDGRTGLQVLPFAS